MNQPTGPRTAAKTGLAHRLYHGETSIDFVGRKRTWFIISGVVILIGLVSLFVRGLNFGIDFKGGSSWEVHSATLSPSKAESIVRGAGVGDTKIEVLHGPEGRFLRVQGDVKGESTKANDIKTTVRDGLAKATNTTANQIAFTDVGPSWGKTISNKARNALIIFFLLIAAYIWFRFEWKMAVAALIAVVHDILVTAGIYSVVGFPVTPGTVVAFLTILGYSLYDTIVVFDKVQENTRGLAASGRLSYSDTVNLSMNQVLMRSLNTSLVAIMPVLSVLVLGSYVLGATALEDFGLALSIGLLTGAYSSIFIASPILAMLKEKEPRYASIRQRIASRGQISAPLTPAAAAAGALGGGGSIGGGGGDRLDPPLRPRGGGGASAGGDGDGNGVARPAAGATKANRPTAKRPPPRPRKKGGKRR